jgi:MFS family permease
MIGIAGFAGIALGCLFLPRMGDLYGRKPIFCACLTLQAPLLFVITWTHSTTIAYVTIFLCGPLIIGRMACGFLLIMELVHSRNAPRVGAGLMVAEGSALIIWTFYFKWIS